jgi:hypothetical protein
MRILTCLAVLCMIIDSASAQGVSEQQRQAFNNLHHTMVTCIAFFEVSKMCISNRARPQEDAQLLAGLETAMVHLAGMVSKIEPAIGMLPATSNARYSMGIKEMRSAMSDNCVNYSVLLSRYAARCKQVTENPDSILAEFMAR